MAPRIPHSRADRRCRSAALRNKVRVGYRAQAIHELGKRVASGELDVEAFKTSTLPTLELRKQLLEIRGVGPYAAANLLMILGRPDFIPIDTYALKMVSLEWHRGRKITPKHVEKAFKQLGGVQGSGLLVLGLENRRRLKWSIASNTGTSRWPARPIFMRRMQRYLVLSFAIIAVSLGIGILGYHFTEGLSWLDSLLNASMILGGMGPVDPVHTIAGKWFASFYALFFGHGPARGGRSS